MLGIRLTDEVGTLVDGPVATTQPTATLREAAHSLAADRVGLLVVVDHRGVLGVISERDIVMAAAEDLDLDEERVRDHASEDLLMVEETDTVLQAAQTMASAEIRHLAIARRGEVTGVVSVRDLMAVLLEVTSDAPA